MLAELSAVAPDHLKDFLLIVLAIASPIAAWVGLYYGRRRSVAVTPDPLRVQPVERWVTRDLCEQMHGATAKDIADVKARVTALENGQREMVEAIDRRMGEMRTEITAGLRGVHERVDNMPLEVVTLLRNTGAIR
jgi:hypothetical protein